MNTVKRLCFGVTLAVSALISSMPVHATDVLISGRDPGASEAVGTFNGATALLTLSNATVTSTASLPYFIPPNVDVGVWVKAVAANAGTSNLVVGFNFTPDNNTYSTTLPVSLTTALTGTNPVTSFFILSRTNFYGVKAIRWDSSSTTQTNLVTISSITYRYLYP